MQTIKTSAISKCTKFTSTDYGIYSLISPNLFFTNSWPSLFTKCPLYPYPHLHLLSSSSSTTKRGRTLILSKAFEETEISATEDEWLKNLPDKKKPLYSHSLPCVEAWLRKLGFYQSKEDRAVWFIEKLDWHAQLSLDVTDLYIRYLKSGPGNLEKDMERRFSYALSREDIENAILGGP